jgi:hypothetical protein
MQLAQAADAGRFDDLPGMLAQVEAAYPLTRQRLSELGGARSAQAESSSSSRPRSSA